MENVTYEQALPAVQALPPEDQQRLWQWLEEKQASAAQPTNGEMAETQTFAKLHFYDTRKDGITLPAALIAGDKIIAFEAKLDPGSSLCVFPRRYGEELGFDIESGEHQRISTVTGGFNVFGHWATLAVSGYEYETAAYFAQDPAYNRNILGRQGLLDRIRLGLVDHDGKLYLSDYNDPAF